MRKPDEPADLSKTTLVEGPDISEQHAIDAWESEGGRQSSALGARDLARTALTENAGWRASHNVGWRADSPHTTHRIKTTFPFQPFHE